MFDFIAVVLSFLAIDLASQPGLSLANVATVLVERCSWDPSLYVVVGMDEDGETIGIHEVAGYEAHDTFRGLCRAGHNLDVSYMCECDFVELDMTDAEYAQYTASFKCGTFIQGAVSTFELSESTRCAECSCPKGIHFGEF